MSIIQELARIESKANEFDNQRTVQIYTEHPRSGEKDRPSFLVRIDFDAPNREDAHLFLDFLAQHGISATLHRNSIDGNINNFKFLPRLDTPALAS